MFFLLEDEVLKKDLRFKGKYSLWTDGVCGGRKKMKDEAFVRCF